MGECCFRNGRLWPLAAERYDDNVEARGFVAMSAARGPVVIYGALYAAVGLNAYAASRADCDGRVLGGALLASNVIATLATVEGVLNSLLSPLFGGFADLTPHRKSALGITFGVVVLTLLCQGTFLISSDTSQLDPSDPDGETFLAVSIFDNDAGLVALMAIFILQTVVYELSALLATSYAPELTSDDLKTTEFVADSFAINNGSQLILTLFMTGLGFVLGFNGFDGGMIGGFITAGWCSLFFFYGFPKLDERREINDELDRRCLGLVHLFTTVKAGICKYPDMFLFLLSWMFVAAAVSSSVGLATSYLQFHLVFDALTINVLLGLALVMSVPGSVLARVWVSKFGFSVKNVYVVVSALYAASFIIAPFILVSVEGDLNNGTLSQFGQCPDPEAGEATSLAAADGVVYAAALFTCIWGLLLGHVYPLNTAIYAAMVPGGEETTWFGVKVTFSKVLTAVPPAAFFAINESGSLQFAIMPLGGMFAAGAVIALFIDMDRAQAAVKDTLHRRRGANLKDPRRDSVAIDLVDIDVKKGSL